MKREQLLSELLVAQEVGKRVSRKFWRISGINDREN